MSELNRVLFVASLYRYALIAAGFACVYMGYRLFRLGYFEKAGELRATYGGKHFLLKQVAPGVFFALFGAATIGFAVVRPLTIAVPVSAAAKVGPPPSNATAGQNEPCSEERFTGEGPKAKKDENMVKHVEERERDQQK